jgi:hypothetical protein
VHVNSGSGPERDDTGLPPIDIEIPDDARELDREVQAYHREQRAERRRTRSMRLRRTWTRDGMVLPLLACCLIFALVTGTLLTLFTASSIDSNLAGTSRSRAADVPQVAPPKVEAAMVEVGGQPQELNTLGPAIMLVVPSGCARCEGTAALLASAARRARVTAYLVISPADQAQAGTLAAQVGATGAEDVSGVLTGSGWLHDGLTAIVVATTGAVSDAQNLQLASDPTSVLPTA